MGEAYDAALSTLSRDAKSELFVRELVAKRIVSAAFIGEDDRERLCRRGLLGFFKPRHGLDRGSQPTDAPEVYVALKGWISTAFP